LHPNLSTRQAVSRRTLAAIRRLSRPGQRRLRRRNYAEARSCMRVLNIIGALNGACALIVLAAAMHLGRGFISEHMFEAMRTAAYLQLISGAALLAIANRGGRLNAIAGGLIGAGAAIFAAAIYGGVTSGNEALFYGAPLGGVTMIIGWIA